MFSFPLTIKKAGQPAFFICSDPSKKSLAFFFENNLSEIDKRPTQELDMTNINN
ncbi:hypothetical protein CHCC20335_3358 [Bacillus paralicheniformis]|nr:hypothetical protein CHCC20335_3358 [Bacillus paralicheniformis]